MNSKIKKALSFLTAILPTFSYVLFAQILFPNKYASFDQVYSADHIVIKNYENKKLEIVEPYQENNLYYVEIVESKELYIEMYTMNSNEFIYVNGSNIHQLNTEVAVSGNNILIESKNEIKINGNYEIQEINNNVVTNNVSISIGTILGILILMLVLKSKFSINSRITITLAVLTIVFFFLNSIIADIYWVLLSADAGWLLSLGINILPEKNKNKKVEIPQNNDLGNV